MQNRRNIIDIGQTITSSQDGNVKKFDFPFIYSLELVNSFHFEDGMGKLQTLTK